MAINEQYYITDAPLPAEQDFKALKEKGLGFIGNHTSYSWTNLNSADPGVTILDQVCFALTELGYCGDFSMGDLLAGPDNQLKTEGRFYLPEEILTTAPVTIADYRKYVIDRVRAVLNCFFIPQIKKGIVLWQVYLLLDDAITGKDIIQGIYNNVYFILNKSRNLGEIFLSPVPLQRLPVTVNGTLEFTHHDDVNTFLALLQQQVRDYIFPPVYGDDFKKTEKDIPVDEILNGPKLENGWIPDEALVDKKDILRVMELNRLLGSIDGVTNSFITGFNINGFPDAVTEIQSTTPQLISVNLLQSIQNGTLTIKMNYTPMPAETFSAVNGLAVLTGDDFYAGVNEKMFYDALPVVKYRDVSAYFSIQNTFPEIYAVGPDTVPANATDYQIAQSRQLKGYLTLFDQALANQFAQLANIGGLFSFHNAMTGAPEEEYDYYSKQDRYEKSRPVHPVPFKSFAPAYYYQSLYNVPQIRPLLKNNHAFAFELFPLPAAEMETKSWEAYKKDPYNSYMRGLMECTDDATVNLLRRNDMLDHLLARYGESPVIVDALINGSKYSGNRDQDRVIFKSLLLQNLGLLSYYRVKGVNYSAADKIEAELPAVPAQFNEEYPGMYTSDFIINTAFIDRQEAIRETDFVNFTALELKLSLLFGLKVQYHDFISEHIHIAGNEEKIQLALWLTQQRRGVLFIETALLQQALDNGAGDEVLNYGAIFIFPEFLASCNTPAFEKRVHLFLDEELPVHVPGTHYHATTEQLKQLIPAYAAFMNSIRYPASATAEIKTSAQELLNLLNQISKNTRE